MRRAVVLPVILSSVSLSPAQVIVPSQAQGTRSAAEAFIEVGDVNGDSRRDFLQTLNAGGLQVVFGNADGTPLDTANPSLDGFRIEGVADSDGSVWTVSSAGDVNGDGRADLVLGAPDADYGVGRAYVVFGKGTSILVNLADLGAAGFSILGASNTGRLGASVSGAGDVNGDGLADVVIGAPATYFGEPPFNMADGAGETYVVFGKAESTEVNLASLGTAGFRIAGTVGNGFLGTAVAEAGDINGDGLADVMVAASRGQAGAEGEEWYVVFGREDTATVSVPSVADDYQIIGRDSEGVPAQDLAELLPGTLDVDQTGLAKSNRAQGQ